VIREELAAGAASARRRRARSLAEDDAGIDLQELCERAGVQPVRVRELEEFGLLEPRDDGYTEADVEIAAVCERLAGFGLGPRHLRAFRSTADRQSGLLEAVVAPALRSRNAERRRAGLEDLQALSEAATELSQLLFARNIRKLAS
jgi:DNA-binding transcriptional MerR regulator